MSGTPPLQRRGTPKEGNRRADRKKGIHLIPTRGQESASLQPNQERISSSIRSIHHKGDLREGGAGVYGTQGFQANEKISRSRFFFLVHLSTPLCSETNILDGHGQNTITKRSNCIGIGGTHNTYYGTTEYLHGSKRETRRSNSESFDDQGQYIDDTQSIEGN